MTRIHGVLLVGPTGSGKTPLGAYLEKTGLWGRRCHHFDFGARLRSVTHSPCGHAGLTGSERNVIRHSLETGALLEDEHFSIATKILQQFIRTNSIVGEDLMILNGLPRHTGQAKAIDGVIDMRMIIALECKPGVFRARIRQNTGGDRTGRIDDSEDDVDNKWRIFRERTAPLLSYYRDKGIRILSVKVDAETGPEDIAREISASSA